MKVFVYGTLKHGHGNHRLLAHLEKEKDGVLLDHMLFDSGFPVCKPNEGTKVTGEVYDIGDCEQTLRSLDRLEGEGSMYIRTPVVLEDGTEVQTYIGPEPYWDFSRMKEIESEDGVFTYNSRW